MDFAELRVSVSWKAYVYRDAEQQRRHESGAGRLGLGEVVDRLLDDLAARGAATQRPDDPHRDEAFVELLTRTYVQTPTVFDA
jgi:hypothetical protein